MTVHTHETLPLPKFTLGWPEEHDARMLELVALARKRIAEGYNAYFCCAAFDATKAAPWLRELPHFLEQSVVRSLYTPRMSNVNTLSGWARRYVHCAGDRMHFAFDYTAYRLRFIDHVAEVIRQRIEATEQLS